MSPPAKTLAPVLFCLLALATPAQAAEPPVKLRYDLRPGDHLIYRQVFERDGKNSHYGYDFLFRKEWTNHVLVTGQEGENFVVGFQRNRTSAELLRFQPRDKDNLEDQRRSFLERLASSPAYFAEGNLVGAHGWPAHPWAVVRESWSEILFDRHELEALPAGRVRPSDTWTAASVLGLQMRVAGWDHLNQEDCLRMEGGAMQEALRIRYWFCPASGTLARLEFKGTYRVFGGRFQEKLLLELVEHRRDEDLRSWLAEPELRLGALEALLVSKSLPLGAVALYPLLGEGDTAVERRILALAYRHRLGPPTLETLAALFESDDPRVRALAVRLLEGISKQEARPLVERALAEEDYFVREAALAWARARLPAEPPAKLTTADEAGEAWDSLGDFPLERAGDSQLAEVARAVQAGDVLSDWSCGEARDWPERALQVQRFPSQPSGARPHSMTTEAYQGWPYIMHVPEDYRGDEPFPLLIYLSGDSGRAMHGVRLSYRVVPQLGYLALFPQAGDYWWSEQATARTAVLVKEVLRSFNVDTNRVYLAGISAGGTGTTYYASHWGDRLAAAVSMMGAGLYARHPIKSANRDPGDPVLAEPPLLANLTRVPLHFLHGQKDTTAHPRASREMVRALKQLEPRAPASLHIFENRGHNVLLNNDEGRTVEFFQQHVRNPFPRRVVFQTRRLRFPRRYWIEVLDKGEGLAEVQGNINDDNTIRVATHNVTRLRLLLRRELFPRRGPVRAVLNGKEVFAGVLPEDCELLQRSWKETADPFRAHSAELTFTTRR